jgi:hypothetical protein
VSGWFQSTDYLGKSWNHLLWHGKAWSIMSTWGVFDKKYIDARTFQARRG